MNRMLVIGVSVCIPLLTIEADEVANREAETIAKKLVRQFADDRVNYADLVSAAPSVLDKRVQIHPNAGEVRALHGREWTPLTAAIACKNYVAASLIVTAGADVNLKNSTYGATPIWMLVSQVTNGVQKKRLVGLLLQYGANPNFAPKHVIDGPFLQTPLHLAAIQRDEEVIKLLLAHGADPMARNSLGETPLDVTRPLLDEPEEGKLDRISVLLKIAKLKMEQADGTEGANR